jgi:hypothetical protein
MLTYANQLHIIYIYISYLKLKNYIFYGTFSIFLLEIKWFVFNVSSIFRLFLWRI